MLAVLILQASRALVHRSPTILMARAQGARITTSTMPRSTTLPPRRGLLLLATCVATALCIGTDDRTGVSAASGYVETCGG